jgi:catechol 2,3-dioxygenase-like lactoylglutathione lyase family enzyme
MRLNHLHLKTPDLKKTQSFYERYFGFTTQEKMDGFWFFIDESGFLLAIEETKPGEPATELPKWFHFGFCLDNPEKVTKLFERMKADNVPFARELTGEDGEWLNFNCFDPSGHKVEVSWGKEDAQWMADAVRAKAGVK